jgi:hypothetical protein
MRDTTATAQRIQLEAIRAMPPAARLAQALALSESNRRLLVAALRVRHPSWTDLQLVELSIGRRLVPPTSTSTSL